MAWKCPRCGHTSCEDIATTRTQVTAEVACEGCGCVFQRASPGAPWVLNEGDYIGSASQVRRFIYHLLSPYYYYYSCTTRTGPRPTTLALSPNSEEVKRKKREQKQALRAKRKREEVAVAQAQAAEKAARNAAKQKKFRHKKKK